jgi:DNA-binding LacI/PurR family transcriptional regulator
VGRVTLQTIADQVGVSRMTVSNAFSRPDQLSDSLRTRILAAAAELGYVGPDPAARALARGTAGSVGVLMTDSVSHAFRDEVATGFLGAISEVLGSSGLALTLISSLDSADRVPARDVPMDGALVYSCQRESVALEWLRRRKLPLVHVDQPPEAGLATINVDDRGGARKAAQHLVDLGHRRVGVMALTLRDLPDAVRSDEEPHVTAQRLQGWGEALSDAGIEPIEVRATALRDDAVYAEARALLERPDRPTGVLCYSDVMASVVIRAAEDLGLSVPEDVSVVGFDDSPLARRVRPQLTTVRQDVEAKGRAAAVALVEAVTRAGRGQAPEPRHELLPTDLVVRDSTGPAPA